MIWKQILSLVQRYNQHILNSADRVKCRIEYGYVYFSEIPENIIILYVLNKSWMQHPTKQQLYRHLTPITKTIQVRRTRHARPRWRMGDELISDILQWTPSHGRAKTGRPARTYIQRLYADSGCSHEDLPEGLDERAGWRERVKDIRAGSATWWCT